MKKREPVAPPTPLNVEFTVYGTPQPQGSAKAFIPKGWKRAIITSDNKTLKPWRQDVSTMALEAMQRLGQEMTHGAVAVTATFWFSRPKSVKSIHKITKPDGDKLLRAICDSMTGIVFKDDSQVVEFHVFKSFSQTEGARVTVRTL